MHTLRTCWTNLQALRRRGGAAGLPESVAACSALILSIASHPIERLADVLLRITQPVNSVDCEFNVADSPVSDFGYVSCEGRVRIKLLWVCLHPNTKTASLQARTTEDRLVQSPANVLRLVCASDAARCDILAKAIKSPVEFDHFVRLAGGMMALGVIGRSSLACFDRLGRLLWFGRDVSGGGGVRVPHTSQSLSDLRGRHRRIGHILANQPNERR